MFKAILNFFLKGKPMNSNRVKALELCDELKRVVEEAYDTGVTGQLKPHDIVDLSSQMLLMREKYIEGLAATSNPLDGFKAALALQTKQQEKKVNHLELVKQQAIDDFEKDKNPRGSNN